MDTLTPEQVKNGMAAEIGCLSLLFGQWRHPSSEMAVAEVEVTHPGSSFEL